MNIQWSDEQLDIFSVYEDIQENIQVNASPGSGKTTIQCEIWNRSLLGNTLYLAFNKAIVEEMCLKTIPRHGSKISTFNSLGHSICMNTWPNIKFNVHKIAKHVRSIEHLIPERNQCRYELIKLVKYLKNIPHALHIDEGDVEDVTEFYDIDVYPDMVDHALHVLKENIHDTKEIDYSDQLLFPVVYNLAAPMYGTVLIDEAQDVNAVQIELIKLLQARNPSLRLCSVGDNHQAIYSFRCALHDSMDQLGREFDVYEMPLTITRRCDRKIVDYAQVLYPHDITASPTAQEGCITTIDHTQWHIKPFMRNYIDLIPDLHFDQNINNTLIVCRTTAPLVSFAYQLLRCNIPCYIRGRDIGENLIKYIEKSQCYYVNDFLDYMDKDINNEIERCISLRKVDRVQNLQDKHDMLEIFCTNACSLYIQDVCMYIQGLFKEGKGIQLSTVHKSKGLEADRVMILCKDLMPHPLASKEWELIQERNIEYVAVTRAKHEL